MRAKYKAELTWARRSLTAKSIIEAAIRALKWLTEQAQSALIEASNAKRVAAVPTGAR